MSLHGDLTWHVDPVDLRAYRRGEVGGVSADSIEAHLLRCGGCRATLATGADPATGEGAGERDPRWEAIAAAIDRPTGWNRSTAWVRLALGTPQLALAGASLALVSLAVPLLVGLLDTRAAVTGYLALAPMAPIVGVLLAYRAAADPAGQIAAATPMHAFRIVLMRTAVVLAAVLPAGALTAVLLPGRTVLLLGWFLPALAGCALVLAVGTRFDPVWVAGGLASTWAVVVWSAMSRNRLLPLADALGALHVNQAAVQGVAVAVAVAAVAYLTRHGDELAYGGVHQ